jgi:predicted DNA-binding transcriptional regulator AlpA
VARPAWTLTEAVQRTGASRSTLRRYQAAGKFPNAYKDSSNAWRFPLEDLLAVGLSPSEPARERALSAASEQVQSMPTEQPTANAEQVSKLEQALREERTRADNAERLAASYLDNVQDLRRALRMLEAGNSQPEQATERAQSMPTDLPMTTPATLTESAVSKPEQTQAVAQDRPLWRRLLSRR